MNAQLPPPTIVDTGGDTFTFVAPPVPDTASAADGVTFLAFASPVFVTNAVSVTTSPTHPEEDPDSVPERLAGH